MLNTCMRDIIVYTWRQIEYAYKVLSIGAKLTERKYKEHVVRLLQVAADWESVDDTEKCAAYMLQVLNDFCAELPFSGDDCCIYRNILKEAREWLPYRYVGLPA